MSLLIKPAAASSIFLVLVLIIGLGFESRDQTTTIFAQARPLSLVPQQSGYSKVFETLGMVCKCCDRLGEDCTSRWKGSCSNLQCIPWRLH